MKNSNPLVSVVVPIYNVENYLRRCVDTILNQTYQNLEIILVDDGATDGSGTICDEYSKMDSRIKVIHKVNGGLSDARNAGIDVMQGEWVSYIDSDDWVAPTYIERMLETALKHDSDVVVSKHISVSDMEGHCDEIVKDGFKEYASKEGIKALLYQEFSTSAWGKLYRTDLWKEIRYPYGKLYEDVETTYQIFKITDKITVINNVLYFYYQRHDSIVRNSFSIKKMDYVDNCRLVLDDVKVNYPECIKAAVSRLFWAEVHVLVHMDNNTEYVREAKELWNDIKINRKTVISDHDSKTKNKLLAILSYGGAGIIRIVYKITQ